MRTGRWQHERSGRATGLALAILSLVGSPQPVTAQPEWKAPPACVFSAPSPVQGDAPLCVRKETYSHDICVAIERFAQAHGLPPDYFARLIWRESLFRPDAVSPKGAEGIAQFMPSTARLRGLNDSFHALEALGKSAEYLGTLRDRYGNLGLAAAAYNAGEAGLENFLDAGRLPYETRAYVLAVTAHSAEEWKDSPPEKVELQLDKNKPFLVACIDLANSRTLKDIDFEDEGVWAPWGVQLAAHFQKSVARNLFRLAVERLPAPINAEQPLIQRERNLRFGRRFRYTARIARDTRSEAEKLCADIRRHGGACIVFRN